MNVVVTLGARNDLQEIDEDYSSKSEGAADKFLLEVEELLLHIGRFPGTGISYKKNFRMFPMKVFPYLIICKPMKNYVLVTGFVHNDRHPKHRIKRIK